MTERSLQFMNTRPNLLKQRLDQVRIASFEETISQHQNAIARLREAPERQINRYEAILARYESVADAYQSLNTGIATPATKLTYQSRRLDTFVAQCEWQLAYLRELEYDFPFVIKQYQTIHQQITTVMTTYSHLIKAETGVLADNGQKNPRKVRRERLIQMRKEAGDSEAYVRAKQLIDQKAHEAALDQLYDAFFTNRNFMYRDVAHLFAQLVSALKSNNPDAVAETPSPLTANQNSFIILIVLTSIIIGFVIDNLTRVWQTGPFFTYAPIALVGILWLGALLLLIRKRTHK